MLPLYERIEKLCEQEGVNITEMCRSAGVPRSALSDYKTGRKKSINLTNMEKMADYFGISIDELAGRTPQKEKTPTLTEKDERDIARKLDAIMEEMTQGGDLMFDGDPMSEEAIESIMAAMKLGLEAAKLKNKARFTPKKYRKE